MIIGLFRPEIVTVKNHLKTFRFWFKMRTIRNCFSNRLFGIFENSETFEPVMLSCPGIDRPVKISLGTTASVEESLISLFSISKIFLDFIIRWFVETALLIRPVETISCSWVSFKRIQLETSCDTSKGFYASESFFIIRLSVKTGLNKTKAIFIL